ncbi:MAG: NHL repeat-containing protein [Nitrospira sp.]|nr:hypothetical protein [Candidatus Manganitrophaceae bacterium]HIL34104.1 hypothetical protein [Candidatus Manganitrophaceae bacterium]
MNARAFKASRSFFILVSLVSCLTLGLMVFGLQAEPDKSSGLTLVATWGTTGEGPVQFREPMGLAFDPEGNLYVADTRNARIQKLSPDGRFLLEWGRPGEGSGEFSKPVDVAVDGKGRVYVSDFDLDRIQVFTHDGVFLNQWGESGEAPGQFTVAAGLGLDRKRGRIYLAEFYNKRVEA